MPELPEVESFRRLLLPLVSSSTTLSFELTSDKPPKSFVSQDDVAALNNKTYLIDVKRKGKRICMVLKCMHMHNMNMHTEKIRNQDHFYLFLHMGMTGRISTPDHVPRLESLGSEDYPPKYTHIKFNCGEEEACFSDPRKFGWVVLKPSLEDGFGELAPDALDIRQVDVQGLIDQRVSIKALLLDQKRVMCGVGNWVADEVLYQSMIHPEQKQLSEEQADLILSKTREILTEAVNCLDRRDTFPCSWLFHSRWSKRSATKGSAVKDAEGRKLAFITAGGRTSAIVPSIQKLNLKQAQQPTKKVAGTVSKVAKGKEEKPTKNSWEASRKALSVDAMEKETKPAKRISTSKDRKRKTETTGTVSEAPRRSRRKSPRVST